MSIAEKIRKLNNARRDYLGRKTEKGEWFRPPNKTAKARVLRWAWRLRHDIGAETYAKILAEVGEVAA